MSDLRFSFDLAEVVFGNEAESTANQGVDRARLEQMVETRFRTWLDAATRSDMHMACAKIDARLISVLSAPCMLEIARLIEARFPEVIENMPNLMRHKAHLGRAHQLAQVFMPTNLDALIRALREEGNRE